MVDAIVSVAESRGMTAAHVALSYSLAAKCSTPLTECDRSIVASPGSTAGARATGLGNDLVAFGHSVAQSAGASTRRPPWIPSPRSYDGIYRPGPICLGAINGVSTG